MSQKNKYEARKRFGIIGQPNLVLHHIDPTLKYRDRERYEEWRDEDLVVMDYGAHSALHNSLLKTGTHHTEETKQKISKSMKGKTFTKEHKNRISASLKGIDHSGEKNSMWGKKHSEESKQKNAESHRGKHRVYRPDGTWYMEKK